MHPVSTGVPRTIRLLNHVQLAWLRETRPQDDACSHHICKLSLMHRPTSQDPNALPLQKRRTRNGWKVIKHTMLGIKSCETIWKEDVRTISQQLPDLLGSRPMITERCVRILFIKHPGNLKSKTGPPVMSTRREKFLRNSEPRIGVVTRARWKLHWKLQELNLRWSILSPKQGRESPPAFNNWEPAGLRKGMNWLGKNRYWSSCIQWGGECVTPVPVRSLTLSTLVQNQ